MHGDKRHLFFDMDDTVTLSRSLMDDDVYELFSQLPHDIIIVSGAQVSQIEYQIRGLPAYRLGQNGNQAVDPDGNFLWQEMLEPHHEEHIRQHIDSMKRVCELPVRDEDDLVEHRGAQISYSLIGHHEETTKKKACDPEQRIRRDLLEKVPFHHEHLEVKIGGTTCFDYFLKGRNKGYNVRKLIEHNGWDSNACLYFGDSIFPGGNDETVIGVIETFPVRDHRHTYDVLRERFAL